MFPRPYGFLKTAILNYFSKSAAQELFKLQAPYSTADLHVSNSNGGMAGKLEATFFWGLGTFLLAPKSHQASAVCPSVD